MSKKPPDAELARALFLLGLAARGVGEVVTFTSERFRDRSPRTEVIDRLVHEGMFSKLKPQQLKDNICLLRKGHKILWIMMDLIYHGRQLSGSVLRDARRQYKKEQADV